MEHTEKIGYFHVRNISVALYRLFFSWRGVHRLCKGGNNEALTGRGQIKCRMGGGIVTGLVPFYRSVSNARSLSTLTLSQSPPASMVRSADSRA